jgi:hypothetical protein
MAEWRTETDERLEEVEVKIKSNVDCVSFLPFTGTKVVSRRRNRKEAAV